MTPFIDIHTHFESNDSDVFFIKNLTQNEFDEYTPQLSGHYSVGLHPWFLNENNFEFDLKKITQLIENENLIALGECGLDRLKGPILDFQIKAFETQIHIAEQFKKPVVIHCVRAFNEVISVKKRLKPSVPLIVHGFNQNAQILNDLIKNEFYISIGAKILRGDKNSIYALQNTPTHLLFLETDDEQINIKEVFMAASDILKMDINILKSIIYENFNTILKTNSRLGRSK